MIKLLKLGWWLRILQKADRPGYAHAKNRVFDFWIRFWCRRRGHEPYGELDMGRNWGDSCERCGDEIYPE